jgi:hypothetical protein
MKEIGVGPTYRIEIDTAKNRIYFWFFGDLVSDASVAGMLDAAKAAISLMKPRFTAFADFTEVNMLGLPDIARQLQTTLLNGGLRKVASVWSHESFAKIIVDSSAQQVKSGEYSDRRKVFKDGVEAEAWLDE